LAGEIRERYELLDHPGFGTGLADSRGYLLQRYLFSSDFHFGPRLRFFAEVQSAFEEGRTGGPRPTDYDPLEIHQAFVDWKIQDSGNEGVTLRVGRQEVGFGSGRLIAPAEGLNLRRSMDGARIAVRKGRLEWNTLGLRADATSGDHGRESRALGSFDPLFPAVPLYSGPAGLLGATNLIDVTPSLGLRFSKSVGLALELSSFWRESLADSAYSPFNMPIRLADPTAGRYVASAPSATISWKATQHVSYSVIYSRFWPGAYFLKELPDRNVNYFTIWASDRF
jgi:hypothetical protein